jgi:DNA invertase Pin-like site-specific DNA recombinase
MKKAAAIYVRVSTPDQHVESQLCDLRDLSWPHSEVSRLWRTTIAISPLQFRVEKLG